MIAVLEISLLNDALSITKVKNAEG